MAGLFQAGHELAHQVGLEGLHEEGELVAQALVMDHAPRGHGLAQLHPGRQGSLYKRCAS